MQPRRVNNQKKQSLRITLKKKDRKEGENNSKQTRMKNKREEIGYLMK